MLIALLKFLTPFYPGLTYLNRPSVHLVLALLTAFFLSLLGFGPLMRYLKRQQYMQPIRKDGPSKHLRDKAGTPTMGGLLIIASLILTSLLWADLGNVYILIVLLSILGFSFIGFIDDYLKLVKKDARGLQARWKYLAQSLLALGLALLLSYLRTDHRLMFPWGSINLMGFYWFFIYFVIVGSSNAVNLTDGLDGLAIFPVVCIAGGLGVFASLSGDFSNLLTSDTRELTILCAILVGSGLGFLWFNGYPAQIFMGDVGALGLGSGLAVISVLIRQEIMLAIMGGLFVVETLSVILQVLSYRLTRKRIFRMAPLHHHFELKGWPEQRVVTRFWIITLGLVLCCLTTVLPD
jgi:phospho-N-acetylmuramoyl-pentapeptide-transferase